MNHWLAFWISGVLVGYCSQLHVIYIYIYIYIKKGPSDRTPLLKWKLFFFPFFSFFFKSSFFFFLSVRVHDDVEKYKHPPLRTGLDDCIDWRSKKYNFISNDWIVQEHGFNFVSQKQDWSHLYKALPWQIIVSGSRNSLWPIIYFYALCDTTFMTFE